jgi:hypothetical protein
MAGRTISLKNPVTQPGIGPGTVRLVAQRLNHYATPGPTNAYTFALYLPEDGDLSSKHVEGFRRMDYL